jgi:AcrR family transcriptional regulator
MKELERIPMADAHRRKKSPERVRIQLLESARRLALKNGLGAVGVEAIAADAGLTKGGLFHHFPSKQALIDAVFQHLLQEFEADLEKRMAADPDEHGRFTRAYVRSVFEDGAEAQWGALWIATLTDPDLRRTWGTWFNSRVAQSGETDLQLENARFAADGVWLGHMFGFAPSAPDAFERHLIEMTKSKT